MLTSLRLGIIRKAFQLFRNIPRITQTAIEYAQTLTRLLLITDPQRLSHAIWYGRPFTATLKAADALMPRALYPSSLLAQLAHHIPSMLLPLFEGAIDMWKLRCKLIHPPTPLPLVRIHTATLRRFHQRQRHPRSTPSHSHTPRPRHCLLCPLRRSPKCHRHQGL